MISSTSGVECSTVSVIRSDEGAVIVPEVETLVSHPWTSQLYSPKDSGVPYVPR